MKKKIMTGLAAVVLASTIGFGAGCDCNSKKGNSDVITKEGPSYETISGSPISVSGIFGHYSGTLSTVISRFDKMLMASSPYVSDPKLLSRGVALIESEMNDGDDEPIYITGLTREDGFEIRSIQANGMTVSFSRYFQDN